MERQNIDSAEGLERALRAIFSAGKSRRKLSQVLAYGSSKGAVSYQDIKQIIKDDPGNIHENG